MRGLVLKGQRRVHMSKESDPRRKVIVATLVTQWLLARVPHDGFLEAGMSCRKQREK